MTRFGAGEQTVVPTLGQTVGAGGVSAAWGVGQGARLPASVVPVAPPSPGNESDPYSGDLVHVANKKGNRSMSRISSLSSYFKRWDNNSDFRGML